MIERRVAFLTDYQNAPYARALSRPSGQSASDRRRERRKGRTGFAEAVARNLFKLMAYKDEYEVARLFTDGTFPKQIEARFEPGTMRFEFHLAPPLLARGTRRPARRRR